jgi:hypothetical protein
MLHFVIKGVELGDFYFIDLSQENYAQKEEEAKNRIDGNEERNIEDGGESLSERGRERLTIN